MTSKKIIYFVTPILLKIYKVFKIKQKYENKYEK